MRWVSWIYRIGGAFFLTAAVWAGPVSADTVESVLMPGPLIEGHADLGGDCKNCHVRFNKSAQSGLCLDCHKKVAADVRQAHGYHGRLDKDKECRECHTDHKGRTVNIAPLEEKQFDHELTDFPLQGGHRPPKAACRDCHKPKTKFRDAPGTCIDCHKKDDKHKGSLGKACADCHTTSDWKTARFDHSKTKFPLTGRHVDVPCKDCHAGNKFKDTPRVCIACHRKDDKHKSHFGEKCESCHTDKNWKTLTFDHDRDTKYPLRGKHLLTKCTACHTGFLYKEKTATTCVACHTKDDKHKTRFGDKCQSCHVEKDWKVITFNHDRDTKYVLRDKHQEAKCTACHTGFLYKEKTATTCVACHTKDDKHKTRFGDKCQSCHVEKDWKVITFNHDRDTKYALRGKHAAAACTGCHSGFIYREKLQQACIACHAKDDKHKGQEGKRCDSCHNETDWKKTRFDHDLTRFPLLGKHAGVACKKCHASVTFKDADSKCGSCHNKEDKHKRALGPNCGLCHNARDWKQWEFDHNKRSTFKLDGGHVGLACESCHKRPMADKVTLAGSCNSCHEGDDVHDGSFGQHCERCHVTSSFKTIRPGSGLGVQ
jgi:hypothetical protein